VTVVFDGGCLGDGPITGVARSFLTGLRAYRALANGRVVLLLPPRAVDPVFAGVEVTVAPAGAWRRQRELPRLLRTLQARVLHSPVAAVPLLAPCPTIATVHDLPWRHRAAGERTPLWRRFATRCALRAATAVLSPSQFTLDAARAVAGRRARLLLVPHGTPLPASVPDPAARNGPLLALGDDRPRKNRARVRAGCNLARQRCRDLPELCFAGPPGNFVDEADKAQLLLGCRLLVQGSLFEGFGLPVLEGLANGAPVVCSDLAPFREIAGDAAVYVDPRDPASIADGVARVHADAALRSRLAAAGPARAAAFSPESVAVAWRTLHVELGA
jgi:hypothetical protein